MRGTQQAGRSGQAEVARTSDGHWIVVDGRRWRATGPSIPPTLRAELVAELMRARRAVAVAQREDDPHALSAARRRVNDAKLALGERGDPWWEPATPSGRQERIRATAHALAHSRAPDRSFCPSDVARVVGGDTWRAVLLATQAVIRDEARAQHLEVLQRGRKLDTSMPWKGPVRVRLRQDADHLPGT
jgi:hypothetical protein